MDKLARHRKIALDFDGTVVEGASSAAIADYVTQHPDKLFYIVTFRTPDQAATISHELARAGLSTDLFSQIVPMPRRLAFDFEEDQQFRRAAAMPSIDRVPEDALLPGEHKLLNWKGFIARKLGATVLVDDMPEMSAYGCRKFGVELVDAKDIHAMTHDLTEGLRRTLLRRSNRG